MRGGGKKEEEKEGGTMLMCRGKNILVEKLFDKEKISFKKLLQCNAGK
jgi:hypothetical protein